MFLRAWGFEILALVTSLAAAVGILIALRSNDGQPIKTWHGFTINTLVSVLSTVTRSLLAVTVSSCLGQWKWLHMSRGSRPLSLFAATDQASQGPYGSFQLMWQIRPWTFVWLGAFITVIALGIEPSLQNIIGFRTEPTFRNDPSVIMARATRYSKGLEDPQSSAIYGGKSSNGNPYHAVFYYPDWSMMIAAQNGLSLASGEIDRQLSSQCSTGNCTWQPFRSLGVCSNCVDLTSSIKSSTKQGNPEAITGGGGEMMGDLTVLTLPNGNSMNNWENGYLDGIRAPGNGSDVEALLTTQGTVRRSNTTSFRDEELLFFSLSMLRAKIPAVFSKDTATATECSLSFCIQKHQPEIENGVLVDTVVDSWSEMDKSSWQAYLRNANDPAPASDSDASLWQPQAWVPRTDLVLVNPASGNDSSYNSADNFSISQTGVDTISNYLATLFAGDTGGGATNQTFGGLVVAASGPNGSITSDPRILETLWHSSNTTALFDNLARSLSISMRNNADNNLTMAGQLGKVETVLVVRWGWAILPLVLIFLGSILLISAMWESKRRHLPAWKTDTLATLFHGLEGPLAESGHATRYGGEMAEQGKNMIVRLSDTNTGVMLRSSQSGEKYSGAHHNEDSQEFALQSVNLGGNVSTVNHDVTPSNKSQTYSDVTPMYDLSTMEGPQYHSPVQESPGYQSPQYQPAESHLIPRKSVLPGSNGWQY